MASGDTLAVMTPLHGAPPAANYAQLDTRNAHPVAAFDAATEEALYFGGVLPRHYAGGGLTLSLHWMGATATSGNVLWGASLERLYAAGDDIDSDSFAAEQTATGAANGTSGKLTVTTIAFTAGAQMDSIAVGEAFRLKIARKAADGSDTMTGDAQLLRIEIKET